MNVLRKAGRAFDKVMDVMLLLAGAIVIIDTILVAQDVIIRKVANYTWSPLYEVLTYSLVWMTFLGTAAIYKDNGHVKLDSFLGMLPKRTQTFINFLTSCAVALLCIFMTFLTGRLTIDDFINGFTLSSILDPPKWPIEIIIPIAFIMLFVQAIRHSVNYFNLYRHGEPGETAEVAEPTK